MWNRLRWEFRIISEMSSNPRATRRLFWFGMVFGAVVIFWQPSWWIVGSIIVVGLWFVFSAEEDDEEEDSS